MSEPLASSSPPDTEPGSDAEPASAPASDRPPPAPTPPWRQALHGWPLIAALALLVRLGYLFTAHGPAFTHPILDADYYDHLATGIAGGEGFPQEPFWQPPLYPLILGWLYRLFGHTLWAPRIFQAALGAAGAALVFETARRLTDKRWAARAAGLLVALHGTLVFYDGELLPTSLAVFVAALVLWAIVTLKPTWKASLGLGAAVGLGALVVAPLLLLLVPAAWAMASGKSRRPLVCVAAALAVLAPVTWMNHARSGEWILISANGGVNLWIGNNPDVDRTTAIRPGAGWEALIAEPEREGAVGAGAQSAWFTRKALGWCASSPGACTKNLGWKARLLLVSRDLPRNEDLYLAREQSPVLSWLAWRKGGTALPFTILWPLAFAGIAAALLARTRPRTLVVVTALALSAPSVLFFVTGRYRAPLVPALCVLAALGLVELAAAREKPRMASIAAALVALALAVWPAKLAVDRVDFRAETHFVVAGRLGRLGDHEGAVRELAQALKSRPDYPEAAYNLAVSLEHLGRHREAVGVYDRLLRRHDDMLEARLRRANALVLAGDLAEAVKAFGDLTRDAPQVPDAWLGLARLALQRGDGALADDLASRAEQAAGGQHAEAAALREEIRAQAR